MKHQLLRVRFPIGAPLSSRLVFFGSSIGSQAQGNADHAAIGALVASLDAAWAKGDADSFAAHFAGDGGFTNVLGMAQLGREAFRTRQDAIFETVYKGSTSKLSIARLRFVRPDVAIADADAEIRGFAALPPAMQVGADGVGRSKLLLALRKDAGE